MLQIKNIKVKKKKRSKLFLIASFTGVIAAIALLIAAIFLVVIPLQTVNNSIHAIGEILSSFKSDLGGKDLTKIDSYVTGIQTQLDTINSEVERYDFLKDMDITKGYYDNLQTVRTLSSKGQVLLKSALPELKTILAAVGYKVDANSTTEMTDAQSDEKLQAFIRQMPSVIKLYNDIEPQIIDLIADFNKLNPNYIPSIGAGSTRDKVIAAQKLTNDFPAISAELKQTLGILPTLLGAEKPANYLIIFQNEKEMRASGGILTAYANMTIDKGNISDNIKAVDMWDIENYVSYTLGIDAGHRNIYGQNVLMNANTAINYDGCGSTYLRAQDAGIYPDLYWTMDTFKDYYKIAHKYNPKKYPDYDNILILNTFFASDLVSLVEPVQIEGQPDITSENLPKVIFGETSSAGLDTSTRKNFIGEVATAVKDKFNSLSGSDFPRVVQMLLRTIQAKNLAFYSKDQAVQSYFDELGMSARTEKNFSGDYFQLNEAQVCSLKSNFYVYDTVRQDIEIKADGSIVKMVNIKWVNEKVYDPKEDFILSASPNYTYRAWIRLFTPKGTTFTASDGYKRSSYLGYRPVTYFDQVMQKQTSDNIITFDQRRMKASDPVRGTELNVSYTLPKTLSYDVKTGYRLLIQKHPGKRAEQYTINIKQDGATTTAQFTLDRDKVLTYRDGIITIDNYDTRLDPYFELMNKIQGL